MFYNSGLLPVGNKNMSHRTVNKGGLYKVKFYGVFCNVKLKGSTLPIKNTLAHPVNFLPRRF